MKNNRALEILLILVTITRSSSGLFSKLAMRSLPTFNLLAVRFGIAGLLLIILFHKRLMTMPAKTLLHGCLAGLSFTIGMVFELEGLKRADTATIAFLESCGVAVIPAIEVIRTRKLPSRKTCLCAGLALIGLFFLTGAKFGFTTGELYGLGACITMSLVVVIFAVYSKEEDSLLLGITEVCSMGVFSFLLSLFFEGMPALPASSSEWFSVLMLALVCTGFSYTLQPVAQSGCSAEHCSLILSLMPVFTMVLGILFLNETTSVHKLIGSIIILAAVILPILTGGEEAAA